MTSEQQQVEPRSQAALASDIICELKDIIAKLQEENALLKRKYHSASANSAAASINAESLREFGYDNQCNVCSFAMYDRDDIVGTSGTECKKCNALICVGCNEHDREMWCDMQHTCQTCKNAILCDCEDICDVCNGSTTNATSAKNKKRAADSSEVRVATWAMTGEAEESEKSEPAAKKRALTNDASTNDKDE